MAWTPGAHRGPLTWTLIASFLIALAAPAAAEEGPCGQAESIVLPNGTIGCSHGPDPEPLGAPPTPSLDSFAYSLQEQPTVDCIGDGTSENRIQALYVVASDKPNRSAQVVPLIRRAVSDVNAVFRASSDDPNDSYLTVRWVHDQHCVVDVQTVIVPPWGDDSFSKTIDALSDAGFDDVGRHYLSWVDSNKYCGIAVAFGDDRPGQENVNNGTYPLWARVDRDCWDRDGMVEAHELTHMLGAVQSSAPHATGNGHCTDEYDIMCYVDAPGVQMHMACTDPASELLLDCNNDDYFDPSPQPGSYLHTHWNVARSAFLETLDVQPEPPPTSAPKPAAPDKKIDFGDVDESNTFRVDISWLRNSGITAGCNPPTNDKFCPNAPVTRGQMAAFLTRGLELEGVSADLFVDDDDSPFETDIEKLAAAGITTGCSSDRFCPDDLVTRGQMAAFLSRALGLSGSSTDSFSDDDASPFESDIERLAADGITTGCTTTHFCPNDPITRAQMAAFLRRALG